MQVSQPVLEVLSAAVISGNALKLTGELDRKLYTDTNKVLTAAGGKWDRKAQAHVFDGDAAEAIEPIILSGTYSRTKQDFGQFDSTSEVVSRLIELADLRDGMKVYEPSCGVGRIVAGIRRVGLVMPNGLHYFANEIDPKRADIARQFFAAGGITCRDFLTIEPEPVFDRIIMNPPFSKQADIDHVLHALKFLKPGGRLISVMSASVRFRQDRKASAFRELVETHGGIFENLPDGAFKESGTMVNTCIVVIDA
jgi:SAM-dependent methyltransferase